MRSPARWLLATLAALSCAFVLGQPAGATTDRSTVQPMFDCGNYGSNQPMSRDAMLTRAQSWIDAHVMYSESACYSNSYGSYRTDCSGYVSMAWGLYHSYTTSTLGSVSTPIARADLQPGDALLDAGTHVALFVRWSDAANTAPVVDEESDYGLPALQTTWSAATASRYTPVRYNNVTGGSGSSGDPVGGVRAYQWGDQELVFERGGDGRLQHWYWIPDGLGTRSDVWVAGGAFVGHPTGFAWNDQEHVFARSANNTLMHWWWTASDMTVHFADWGGQVYSDPTAFVWNGQQHIFAKNAVGGLWHWYWDPGTAAVSQVPWNQNGVGLVGNPSGFVWRNQQHVVACGPSHTLLHWWWSQDTGTVSFADWGGQCYSDPTTFVWNGQQHIFARNSAGQLWHWYWDPGTATVSQVAWNQASGKFVGNPYGFKFGNQQHVVACGPQHTLFHWWWSQDTGVVSFADWGGQCYDDPVAFVYAGSQQQIFAKSGSGTLYHWWWTPEQGALQNSWGGSVG
jgi:Repeat of unknown function (DUF346)